ncbi:MAG TPA: 3-phosphoshikimate 1-carboxyvinyltransferase [Candidatus Limnocylindria bacterium]|jgi:3-phosphoshikimate 1-carboxyvinyltransferase|nr:3-phosphoshikimate 1-carboxyvinyltransferase [Candidatus Limnocylindria bacterium]
MTAIPDSSTLRVPGDKSIAHRVLMLAALAEGTSRLRGLPDGLDVASTRRVLTGLGVTFRDEDGSVVVEGIGGRFRQPSAPLDCGNSGTTMRLMTGLLATRPLTVTLDGDDSLRRRPMRRVAAPLAPFGARIELSERGTAPIVIHGNADARGVEAEVALPSAQIKSALLLAALGAQGRTRVHGALASRDHTERLFTTFGVPCAHEDGALIVEGPIVPRAADVEVPGDFSSAAFLLAAAAARPGGHVVVDHVSLNPTRTAFLDVLRRFGAEVTATPDGERAEPLGAIAVRGAALRATTVDDPAEIPGLIDELPLVGVLAMFAQGTTVVRGAHELRVKESDRIETFANAARALGAQVETFEDGFAVHGPATLHDGAIVTGGDHRIAMAFAVAARVAGVRATLDDPECVAVSFPGFAAALEAVR